MKRQLTRWFCLFLILSLMVGISPVFAAYQNYGDGFGSSAEHGFYSAKTIADNEYIPTVETGLTGKYQTYAALGDSISAGFGDYDYYKDGSLVEDINNIDESRELIKDSLKWEDKDEYYWGWRAVDKAYHSIVAKSAGTDLIAMGFSGTRTSEIRGLLEPDYVGDDYMYGFGLVNNYVTDENGTKHYQTPDPEKEVSDINRSYGYVRQKYIDAIKTSDLISLNLGSNDIMTIPGMYAMWTMYGFMDGPFTKALKELYGDVDTEQMTDWMKSIQSTALTLGQYGDTAEILIRLMVQGYKQYFSNIIPVIQDIQALNPDADLAVIGLYNPFQKIRWNDDALIPVGTLGTSLINSINLYLKSNASRYHYVYVDVTATETQDIVSLSEGGLDTVLGRILTDCHPSYAGQEHMASQILNAVEQARGGAEQSPKDDTSTWPYSDVPESGTWYSEAVGYVTEHGLMAGTAATRFDPNVRVTRAMVVQVLYAMDGKPQGAASAGFGDVVQGSWYEDAVNWAYANHLVAGYNVDSFRPDEDISRQQLAAILYQYAVYKGYDSTAEGDLSGYTDADDVTAYARTPMQWAVGHEMISGTKNGLEPKGTATRAQLAVILQKFDQNIRK